MIGRKEKKTRGDRFIRGYVRFDLSVYLDGRCAMFSGVYCVHLRSKAILLLVLGREASPTSNGIGSSTYLGICIGAL